MCKRKEAKQSQIQNNVYYPLLRTKEEVSGLKACLQKMNRI